MQGRWALLMALEAFLWGITPQTHGRVSASPTYRLEGAWCLKLSIPPRPGAVAARGLVMAGTTPVSCILRKAVVSTYFCQSPSRFCPPAPICCPFSPFFLQPSLTPWKVLGSAPGRDSPASPLAVQLPSGSSASLATEQSQAQMRHRKVSLSCTG